jgi:hypothetical protein
VPPTEAALRRRRRQRRRAAIIETMRTAGGCSLIDACAKHLEMKNAEENSFIKEMAEVIFVRTKSAGVLTAAVVPNAVTFNCLDIRKAEDVFETMTTARAVPNVPDVVTFNCLDDSLDIKYAEEVLETMRTAGKLGHLEGRGGLRDDKDG